MGGVAVIIPLIKEQKGLTLIELLMALSILLVVLTAGYIFNDYVNKSINLASSQAELQFQVRLASEKIENRVRYASNSEILLSYPGVSSGEAIYESDNTIMLYEEGATQNLLGDYSPDLKFHVDFNKTADGFLWYKIVGEKKDGQTYEITKEIRLLNEVSITKNFGDATTTGKAFVYTP